MAFAGMIGKAIAQQMIRQRVANAANNAVNAGGGYRGAFQSSGKYLFVAHPNCCPKCTKMNGTLWNTPDVAFISHPNCKCATIEAPAGLSPAELMAWTKSPVGVMRFGFNYGESLKPVQLTVDNRDKVYAQWHERMDPESVKAHPRRLVRAKVSQAQIDAIRAKVKSGELTQGTDLTKRIEGMIKAKRTRELKNTEAGKLADKMLGGTANTRIVEKPSRIRVSFPKNAQRNGPLELPKLRNGTTWDPNAAFKKKRAQASKTFVKRLKDKIPSTSTNVKVSLPSRSRNEDFAAALVGLGQLAKGTRSKASKAFSERQKRKRKEDKDRLERLKRQGLL